jgi:hypothetical protein
MELFLDKQYLKESTNKPNYQQVIYNISHNIDGLVIEGLTSEQYIAIKSDNTLLIYSKPGFDVSNVHVKKNNVFCYETRISATTKKFILDIT